MGEDLSHSPEGAEEFVAPTTGSTPEQQPQIEANEQRITLPENLVIFPETKSTMTIDDLRQQVPDGPIISLDFTLEDENEPIENWDSVTDSTNKIIGFTKGSITNLDHHSKRPEFQRQISTANLAIEYVKKNGPVTETPIMIHHYDADSILSALILAGTLKPEDRFGEAAIAADHTGEANAIADLLQAVQDKHDPAFSLRNLNLLLEGKTLDPEAQQLLEQRLEGRKKLENTKFHEVKVGGNEASSATYLATVGMNQQVEGEFAPAQVPEAALILIAKPMVDKATGDPKSGYWEIKVRSGKAFADGESIRNLELEAMNYGGRWNAGSTNRGGGVGLKELRTAPELAEAFRDPNKQPKDEDVPRLFAELVATRYARRLASR